MTHIDFSQSYQGHPVYFSYR